MRSARPDSESNVVRGVFSAFERREDDFSISLSLPDDPMFWLRLDKDSAPGSVILTDFARGAQEDHAVARGLAMILADAGSDGELDVVFHDLVPGNHDPACYRVELNRITQSVQRWCELAGRLMGKKVGDVRLDTMRGKAQLIVRLL